MDDRGLKEVLRRTRTIACVGGSARPARPSHGVMAYMIAQGYSLIPVNPAYAGHQILGRTCYAGLGAVRDAGVAVDMVNIFRRSDAVGPVVDDALDVFGAHGLHTIWMQLGIIDRGAAARAEARGVTVVMDRCLKIEHRRLIGG